MCPMQEGARRPEPRWLRGLAKSARRLVSKSPWQLAKARAPLDGEGPAGVTSTLPAAIISPSHKGLMPTLPSRRHRPRVNASARSMRNSSCPCGRPSHDGGVAPNPAQATAATMRPAKVLAPSSAMAPSHPRRASNGDRPNLIMPGGVNSIVPKRGGGGRMIGHKT